MSERLFAYENVSVSPLCAPEHDDHCRTPFVMASAVIGDVHVPYGAVFGAIVALYQRSKNIGDDR